MSNIEPESLKRGTTLVVTDNDSRYDGTEGRALHIYDDRILLELDVWMGCGKLTREFDLDKLEYP